MHRIADLVFGHRLGIGCLEDGLSRLDDLLLRQRPLQQRQQREVILLRNTFGVALVQPPEHVVQDSAVLGHCDQPFLTPGNGSMPKWWMIVPLVIQSSAATTTSPTSTNNNSPRYFSIGFGAVTVPFGCSPPAPAEKATMPA